MFFPITRRLLRLNRGTLSINGLLMSQHGTSVNRFISLFRLLRNRLTSTSTNRFPIMKTRRHLLGTTSNAFRQLMTSQTLNTNTRRNIRRLLPIGKFTKVVLFSSSRQSHLRRLVNHRPRITTRTLPTTTSTLTVFNQTKVSSLKFFVTTVKAFRNLFLLV